LIYDLRLVRWLKCMETLRLHGKNSICASRSPYGRLRAARWHPQRPADDNKFIWNSGAIHVYVVCFSSWHNASFENIRKPNMKNKVIISGVLAAAIIALGAAGCASEKQEQAELQAQAKISKEQAQQTALAKAPGGTIKEGELEKEKGKLIWSFDITIPDSKDITEVNVDAITGDVVSVEKETPEQQAKEKD